MSANPYQPPAAELGKPAIAPRRRRRSLWWGAAVGVGLWGVYSAIRWAANFILKTYFYDQLLDMPFWLQIPALPVVLLFQHAHRLPLNSGWGWALWYQAILLAMGAAIYGPTGALIQLALRLVARSSRWPTTLIRVHPSDPWFKHG